MALRHFKAWCGLSCGLYGCRYVRSLLTILRQRKVIFCNVGPAGSVLISRDRAGSGGEDFPSVWYLKLEPNDDRFPVLDFEESYYRLDDYFCEWFNALPDLDALDKVRPKDSNFGLV